MMYENITTNKTSPRNHKIDRFTPHCIVGLWSAKQGADYFTNKNIKASANYIIGKDGDVAISVKEEDRAWTSSSRDNDNRAITVECASDTKSPYKFPDKTYLKLIDLCVDVCKRYNKSKLVYIEDKEKAIKYEPKDYEMQLTLHRFFANKACPGDWFVSMIPHFINQVNLKLGGSYNNMYDFINSMAILIKKYYTTFNFNNVSVPLAQSILESNFGKSELAINANNYFGLKHRENRCPSSIGVYIKEGSEQNPDGTYTNSTMTWEKFSNMEDSVKGYYEFLTNAPNGRYDNLKGVNSPEIYIRLIKDDGYATSNDYVEKILNIIDEYDLRKYDIKPDNDIDKIREIKNKIDDIFKEYGL